jgi:hypothetical protein
MAIWIIDRAVVVKIACIHGVLPLLNCNIVLPSCLIKRQI